MSLRIVEGEPLKVLYKFVDVILTWLHQTENEKTCTYIVNNSQQSWKDVLF